jgi:hypothetical protein
MVFNPLLGLNPQQQQQFIKMQEYTKKIHYIIHTEDSENRVEVSLVTEDPEAAQLLSQIKETIVNGITQTLYQFFGMSGERV